MRTCTRCHSSTPTGLRFCNYCGARLGVADPDAPPVLGNLALKLNPAPEPAVTPEEAAPYQPPSHLRLVPDPPPRAAPLTKARRAARSLAETLPGRAREIAGVAGQLAGAAGRLASRAGATVKTAVQQHLEARRTGPDVTPAPAANTAGRPAPEEVHPDLRIAYRTYLAGREAYELGNRQEAARLFAMALRQSPPESPLGQFLRRVLKQKKEEASRPVAEAPRPPRRRRDGRVRKGTLVDPRLAHPSETRGQQVAQVFGGSEAPPPRSPPPVTGDPTGPADRRPIRGGLAPARAPETQTATAGAAVARRRGAPRTERARKRQARERARELWFRDVQTRSPNRPSFILDEADGGKDLERIAGVLLVMSGVMFLALLLL